MQYVETHLTTHHLLRAPHRWFFAVLLSPLHAAELHYERRYKLTYTHAKKLFVFDLLLLLSAILLIVATTFWYTYNPTVTDAIDLGISISRDGTSPADQRLRSGDAVTYTFSYRNNSQQKLTDAHITVELPPGFLFHEAAPSAAFSQKTNTFALDSIAPGAGSTMSISGILFGTPNEETTTIVRLSYTQDGSTTHEVKVGRIYTSLRGSVIEARLTNASGDSATSVFARTTLPVQFSIVNSSQEALPAFTVTLPSIAGATLEDTQVDSGTITQNTWSIPDLPAGAKVSGTATLRLRLANDVKKQNISLIPHVVFNGHDFAQTPGTLTLTVESPAIELNAEWKDGDAPLTPGETSTILIHIKNTGATTLNNARVTIPTNSAVVKTAGNAIVIDATKNPDLRHLLPQDVVTLEIPLAIQPFISTGSNLTLNLTPTLTASSATVSVPFETTATLPSRKILTALNITAESRYYTVDGDQLGRGPLPPTVGKETKYSALIAVNNSTNDVRNTMVTATLPPGVSYTGKHSITAGKTVIYDDATRTITWTIPLLAAHEEAGMYLELAIKPTEADRGRTLPLLRNITVKGTDDFLTLPVGTTTGAIDTSIPTDTQGKAKGTAVK